MKILPRIVMAVPLLLGPTVGRTQPSPPSAPAVFQSRQASPTPDQGNIRFLDNGIIRVGVNLDLGGAITYLSPSGSSANLVNNYDYGRQIQMSFFSGPVPFAPAGQQPAPHWDHIGWNPVQAGDYYGNRSAVISSMVASRALYVKTVPLHWPLNRVPGECTYEWWISLEADTVQVRCRFFNRRSDPHQYPARNQELPAVYTVGTLHRLVSYTGSAPFTGGQLTVIPAQRRADGFPWTEWHATENWAALLNDQDWGLGVWQPSTGKFLGGFTGTPGAGGTLDAATGFISPIRQEIIDHNIQYEYAFTLILGSLERIRAYAGQHANREFAPHYDFRRDRQGWHYRNASDDGWPIRNGLTVESMDSDPQMIGPTTGWPAQSVDSIYVRATHQEPAQTAKLYWRRSGEDDFSEKQSLEFPVIPDGLPHLYRIPVSSSPDWSGHIVQLRLDPWEKSAASGPHRAQIHFISARPE